MIPSSPRPLTHAQLCSSVPDFILSGDVGHIIDGLLGTGPIVDGEWVVAEPMGAVESGAYWGRTVPVLLGTNSGEGQTFIYDGVDFPLPGFLIPPAYVGLLGFNVTAGELANAQPRYNSSAYADGREPLSYMVVRSTPQPLPRERVSCLVCCSIEARGVMD